MKLDTDNIINTVKNIFDAYDEAEKREAAMTPEDRANRAASIQHSNNVKRENLAVRARRLAIASIGKQFAIRESKNCVFRGTIAECCFKQIRTRGQSIICQWAITLEGPTGNRRSFLTETLPR